MAQSMTESLVKTLATTLRADRMVQAAFGGFVVLSLLLMVFPKSTSAPAGQITTIPGAATQLLHLGLLSLVLISLIRRLDAVQQPEERSFWWRIVLAFSCWLAGDALVLLPDPLGPIPHRPLEVVFYALIYIFMIRAVELRPHHPRATSHSLSERLLTWPAVTFFVLGLTLYFVIIPLSTAPATGAFVLETPAGQSASSAAPASVLDDFLFYALLDLYLSVRFLLLARTAATQRWRVIYTALALPWLALFLSADLGTIASHTAFVWPLLPAPWLRFPFVLQVLAVRLRQYPFSVEWDPGGADSKIPLGVEQLSFIVSARTLALGVIFPMIHILALRFDLINAPGHSARQILVLVWLIFFGIIALLQHRQLERAAENLWLEQSAFEEALRASEKDLRLILERDRGSRMLEESEHKFDFAFRSCPYTLMITRLRDGLCLEVNPAFEDMFGHRRRRTIGLSADQLGLWSDPDVATVRRLIEGQGQIREVEILFQRPDGSEGHALLSAAGMKIGDEQCLLTIVHDVTDRREAERLLSEQARPLRETRAAIFEIHGDGRIRAWNDGATALFGWAAEEAIGQPVEGLVGLRQPKDQAGGECRLNLVAKNGQLVSPDAWRTPLGEDGSWLVVAKAS